MIHPPLPLLSDVDEGDPYGVDDVAKHYGPGPHPGTNTPQTVHTGGMSQGTQPSLFPGKYPNRPTEGRVKLKFRTATPGDFRPETWSSLVDVDFLGRPVITPEEAAAAARPFNDDERLTIVSAVEEFEFLFPGALPDNIDVVMVDLKKGSGITAWVDAKQVGKVFVNESTWVDKRGWVESAQRGGFAIYRESGGPNWSADEARKMIPHYQRAVIVHELTHAAMAPHWTNAGGHLPFLPRYDQDWYPNKVYGDSRLLPSAYSTEQQAEFLAEAAVDVLAHGERAAPHSRFAVDQMRALFAGASTDELQERADEYLDDLFLGEET